MILTQKGSLRFICRNVIFPLSLSFVYSIWRLGSFFGQQEDEGMLSCCIYRFDIFFGVSSQKPQVFPCLSSLHHSPWVIFCFPPRQTVSFYIKSWEHDTSDAARKQLWVGACHGGELWVWKIWKEIEIQSDKVTYVKLRFSGALFLSFLYLWSKH